MQINTAFLIVNTLCCFAVLSAQSNSSKSNSLTEQYQSRAARIIETALADSSGFDQLAELCDTFGPRFSATENLEQAIEWALKGLQENGFDNVHGEPVMVPRWVRGAESATLLVPWKKTLHMLGLGGSVATPPEGITAEVLVVGSFDELEQRASEATGKIVLYDVPFTSYGKTVRYRYGGASAAAKAGAVASLIRSVGPYSMNTPHTGAMQYEEGVKKIPHAAITAEDAAMLHRLADRGIKIKIQLKMEAKTLEDVLSNNVVAELKGSEKPEEVIVISGHMDSWDVGQGAMDDGSGCIAAWQAVKILKDLNLRPRRTIRIVFWTNEENGLRGGKRYRDDHKDELGKHVAAIESDNGVFSPLGFGFTGSEKARELLKEISDLLTSIKADSVFDHGGGADIGPIMEAGVPGIGLKVDTSRYFWYHHTNADTWDKLDQDEFNRCVAALAVMSYVIADMPVTLPR